MLLRRHQFPPKNHPSIRWISFRAHLPEQLSSKDWSNGVVCDCSKLERRRVQAPTLATTTRSLDGNESKKFRVRLRRRLRERCDSAEIVKTTIRATVKTRDLREPAEPLPIPLRLRRYLSRAQTTNSRRAVEKPLKISRPITDTAITSGSDNRTV